jgi:hypothetical protein
MTRVAVERVIARIKELLRRCGQLSKKQEIELVLSQILRLLRGGKDQWWIRRMLVGSGAVDPDVFDAAWRESLKYQKEIMEEREKGKKGSLLARTELRRRIFGGCCRD